MMFNYTQEVRSASNRGEARDSHFGKDRGLIRLALVQFPFAIKWRHRVDRSEGDKWLMNNNADVLL
jgi:hypothetical protein